MKRGIYAIALLALLGAGTTRAQAQTSGSSNLVAQPIPDRTVPYSVAASGTAKPLFWGLDTAWPNEGNMRRGIAFMGADRVDIVRASFQPTYPLVNGDLQQQQIDDLNYRLYLISLVGAHAVVALNCDHPSVDPWYSGNASNWAQLMDVTTRRVQEAGRTVVCIAPFNEPDYGWGQGTNQDFYNIAGILKTNSRFNNIRISGGNTLSCDEALNWYNYLKDRLDEGNTHQLAGSFDSFANFYQTVKANGDYATGDELHNVMEAMVGVEYGMQTGIWWGTAELARGEFVKASDGVRLGYAEHRPNWTAASVYRNLNGKVQAFGGTSERQAATTTYRFLSKDKDVYYDGNGPQREYTMVMPGGTGYQQGQTNAERVVNITWGEDIQPAINGKYVLVNRNSGKVMQIEGGATTAGANLEQGAYTGATSQQWNVTPVDSRIGGDFSYYAFTAVSSGKVPDVLNWSLDNGSGVIVWDDTKGANQQWYLEYVSDGWFYIRNRNSAKCLDVNGGSVSEGENLVQWDVNGGTNQQWRFLPAGAAIEFVAPGVPANLVATAQPESIKLTWTANPESDIAGYNIYRAESVNGPFNTIARNVTTTSFVDNSTTVSGTYYYKIKAIDKSLNRSAYSAQVSATPTGANAIVAQLNFDGNATDASVNLNHSSVYGTASFVTGKVGTNAIALNGSSNFVQLPYNVANQQAITVATWVYWNGGGAWQRIFDFGNDESQNMFLTPNSSSGTLRFAIKNGGGEQQLNAAVLPTATWTHVAVTLSGSVARMYVNGTLVNENTSISISPLDFKPVANYIGRSQYPDPLFNGRIDDFRVYNYALSASEIAGFAGLVATSTHVQSIVMGTATAGAGKKRGTAKVTIYNNVGNPVSGATVTGSFSGTFSETASGVTGTDGSVLLQTVGTAKTVTVNLCVTNVAHATLPYDGSQNVVTCSGGGARFSTRDEEVADQQKNVFTVSPNPIKDVLNLSAPENSSRVEISIIDVSGRPVLQSTVSESESQLNVSGLQAGTYILRIKSTKGITNQRIIKQ